MSGTFDLFSLAQDSSEYRIHAQVYGARKAHAERWRVDDSLTLVGRLKPVDLLLIHGQDDPYVPAAQSAALAQAMTKLGASVTLQTVQGGGHDWTLWSGHLRQCLDHLVRGEE